MFPRHRKERKGGKEGFETLDSEDDMNERPGFNVKNLPKL